MSIENIDTVPWRVVDDARALAAEATVLFPVLWRANAAPTWASSPFVY